MRVGIYVDQRNPPELERSWRGFYEDWLERIATAEEIGPLRHAALIAEEAIAVDLISDGRLDLGGARGITPSDGPSREGLDIVTLDQAQALLAQRYDGLALEHVFCWASISNAPDDLVDRHIELVGALARRLADPT